MKRFVLFIVLLTNIIILNAQDIIVFRDDSEIKAKVLEIDYTNVKYKKWENLNGPTYNVPQEKVLYIMYANGTKEKFNNIENKEDEIEKIVMENCSDTKPFIKKPRFQGYIYGEYYGYKFMQGIDLSICTGSRISDYVFVGLESGFCFLLDIKQVLIPVHFDLKIYYPIKTNLHPFICISQGIEFNNGSPIGNYPYNRYESRLIYSGKIGIGCDIKAFSFCIGWYRFASYDNFYIGIGVNLCWRTRDR